MKDIIKGRVIYGVPKGDVKELLVYLYELFTIEYSDDLYYSVSGKDIKTSTKVSKVKGSRKLKNILSNSFKGTVENFELYLLPTDYSVAFFNYYMYVGIITKGRVPLVEVYLNEDTKEKVHFDMNRFLVEVRAYFEVNKYIDFIMNKKEIPAKFTWSEGNNRNFKSLQIISEQDVI